MEDRERAEKWIDKWLGKYQTRQLSVEGKDPDKDFSYKIDAETKKKVKGEACTGVWVVKLTEGNVAPDGPKFEAVFEMKLDTSDNQWMGNCKYCLNLSDPGDRRPMQYIDGVLYKAMKGWGTDEKAIMTAAGKIDSQRMWWEVQECFKHMHKDMHKGNLLEALRDELTGGEEKMMQEILKNNGIDWDKPKE